MWSPVFSREPRNTDEEELLCREEEGLPGETAPAPTQCSRGYVPPGGNSVL